MPENAKPFVMSTRFKTVQLSTLTRPTGGGLTSLDLPKAGILSSIILAIRGSVSGTLSSPNAYGFSSVIRRVTVNINSGHKIFDMSGPGYHFLFREFLGDQSQDALSYTNARTAVTATTFNLDMIIPISQNMRDELGLIMLQNEGTLVNLTIDWETDATVATGATVTATAIPMVVLFEVPSNPHSWPAFNSLHQCIEEQIAIPSAVTYDHQIPRGATLLGQYYLYKSAWTQAQLIVQQSNVIYTVVPNTHQALFAMNSERDVTLSGAITGNDKRLFWDFAGSDGLGQFGTIRDVIDTNSLTSIFSRITVSGADTLYAVRRQIVPLG